MGIVTSYLGNQLSSKPANTSDFLADYFGKQLANSNSNPQANVTPQSTTINYNEDGTADVTHKQTIGKDSVPGPVAPDVQQQAPVTMPQQQAPQPAPVAPVAPPGSQPFQNATQAGNAPPQQQPQQQPQPNPQIFKNMIQTESGGQQYNPQGGILTSPKGAQGIAQIMPATGANPGYGIAPATPQELATPQGNQAFGQRYFEGMYNHFGQDPEKAAAAYNAGPGTVEKAMQIADTQGGRWQDYVPNETKDYLQKVFKGGKEIEKKLQPYIAGMPTSDIGMTPTEQAIHHIVLNSKDPNALGMGAYAGEHLLDPATKMAMADEHATVMENNRLEKGAEKKAQEIIANGGVGLQRALKEEGDEGSYLKAYLFQRLGLHDLAKNEQQKLGAGDVWAQTMVDGKPAWVKYNGQGAPVKGYNELGELSGKELLNTMNMKGVTQHTQAYQDRKTKELYFLQTTPQGPRMVSTNGKVYGGDTSNLMAYGIGADVERKNIEQLNALRNKLAYATPEVNAKLIAEWEFQHGKLSDEERQYLLTPQGTVQPGQAMPGGQPQPQGPQGGAVGQNLQNQGGPAVPQQQQPQQQAPAQGPAIPGQQQPQQQAPAQGTATPSPYPGIPGVKPLPRFREPGYENETRAQFDERTKIAQTENQKIAGEVAELKTKFPDYQAQIDKSIRTINDVLTHPGFETNVGVPGVTGLLQLPGTSARDWQAKYKQLTGETFLSAFSGLKGGGAISDKEGAAATEAQAALKDPRISEEEFRRNAKILEDTLKSGVNRARIKIGQQPDAKYMLGDQKPEEKKKAYEWAIANKQDPRSGEILTRLGLTINE